MAGWNVELKLFQRTVFSTKFQKLGICFFLGNRFEGLKLTLAKFELHIWGSKGLLPHLFESLE